MSFDLQIAGTLFNGTCIPLNLGNVVLSYRIGTNRQWKVIEEYSSVGKHCYKKEKGAYIGVKVGDGWVTVQNIGYKFCLQILQM